MSGILIDQMMSECKAGSVEGVKSSLLKNKDINVTDKEGKCMVHHAVINNRGKMLAFLISEAAELDLQDTQGKTALHYACELELKDLIICLLVNKTDYNLKANDGLMAGEKNPDISIFMGNVIDEEKCFKVLSPEQVTKLTSIYNDIDYDKSRKIDIKKSIAFNHFIDPRVSSNALMRDAEEFLEEVAIINRTDVCLDEWIYAFSKLLFCDKSAFNKFLNDYESACNTAGGSFSEIMINKDDI